MPSNTLPVANERNGDFAESGCEAKSFETRGLQILPRLIKLGRSRQEG